MLPSENKTQDQPPQKNETVRAPSLTTPPKDHHTRELLPQRTLIDLPKENNPITQLCSELTNEFTSLKLILYLNPNPTSQIAPTLTNLTRVQYGLINILIEFTTFHSITLDSYPTLEWDEVNALIRTEPPDSHAQTCFQFIFFNIQGFVKDLIFFSCSISRNHYESIQKTYPQNEKDLLTFISEFLTNNQNLKLDLNNIPKDLSTLEEFQVLNNDKWNEY